jgi:hypothetical protein
MRTLVVAVVVGVGLLGGALGGRPAALAADDPPCRKDVSRWCSEMPDMDGYLTTCLQGHWNDISSQCRKTLTKDPDREIKVRHACKADVDKLCGSELVPGFWNLDCLARNRDKLSTKCRDVLEPKAADAGASEPKPADGVEIITPKGSDLAPIEVKPSDSE